MTKEQQDIAWACLPKEARAKIKIAYTRYDGFEYSVGYNDALNTVFGQHNLTSDTEPEEMLMVERRKVIEKCTEITEDYADSGSRWCRIYKCLK